MRAGVLRKIRRKGEVKKRKVTLPYALIDVAELPLEYAGHGLLDLQLLSAPINTRVRKMVSNFFMVAVLGY